MSSINFFDLTDGIDRFVVDGTVPAGVGIRGLNGADVILGFTTADCIYGNDGADEIAGGDEADTLQGGRGADLLFGNAGADYLRGERGNDLIFGGQGNDLIQGNEGDDFLGGDAGFDTIVGGDGSDAFVLDTRHTVTDPAVADIITDFNRDEDGDVFALTDGAGDALSEADVTLEASGSDTLIRLTATGGILARVQGASPDLLAGAFSTASATLDDTEPGAQVLGLVPGGNTLSGFVGDEDYLDFFQFQVTETSIIDFSLSGMSADAELLLYEDLNDDGELGGDEIISASERSGTADETIENVTLDPGKYFLAVEQFEGDTNYNLSINGVAGTVARDLAGDRPSTARALPPDGEVELHDYVGGTDAVDTYQLEVLNGGYLDLFTDYQLDGVDLELTLWSDLNGNDQFDADEVVAQGTNEIVRDALGQGTYYINVTAPGEATPYEILALSAPGSRVDIESYNSLYPGIAIAGNLDRNDRFDPNDSENYADPYLLSNLEAGLTVTLTQESEDFDAYLTVVDLLTGEVVAENDDIDVAGENFNAQVRFTTEEGGQYVVFASSVDAPGFGDYTLDTTITGTPIETDPRRSRNDDTQLQPTDLPTFKLGDETFDTVYQPLTGGLVSSIGIDGVNQGGWGDCFFLSAMASTFGKIEADLSNVNSLESAVLNNAITTDGTNYTVTFYQNSGNTAETRVAEQQTVGNQVVAYPQTVTTEEGQTETLTNPSLYGVSWVSPKPKPSEASGQQIWASVFERAYALLRGGYGVINRGGDSGDALRQLTGRRTDDIQWNPAADNPVYNLYPAANYNPQTKNYSVPDGFTNPSKEEVFTRIQTTLNGGGYVTAGSIGGSNSKSLYGGVIVQGHAYSVHNAYEVNGEKLILLHNPWGVDNQAKVRATEDPNSNTQDGFITIKFDAFLENYSGLSFLQGS